LKNDWIVSILLRSENLLTQCDMYTPYSRNIDLYEYFITLCSLFIRWFLIV